MAHSSKKEPDDLDRVSVEEFMRRTSVSHLECAVNHLVYVFNTKDVAVMLRGYADMIEDDD